MDIKRQNEGEQSQNKIEEEGKICEKILGLFNNVQNLKELFNEPDALNNLLKNIDVFAREMAKGVTKSQIRKFYEKVRKMEQEVKHAEMKESNEIKRTLILLKPLLAYTVGKNRGNKSYRAFDCLNKVISKAIDLTSDVEDFKCFVELFQAIVAYHRYHCGN